MTNDTQYPVRYYSVSKKKEVALEAMPDMHILNARRKLQTDPDANVLLSECMDQEIARRGLDIQYVNGKPPEPPPAEPESDL